MEKLLGHIYTLIARLKVPVPWVYVVSILLFASFYILDPGSKPYVNVPGAVVFLDLPSFDACDISFRDSVRIRSYVVGVQDGHGALLPAGSNRDLVEKQVNHTVSVLSVTNPIPKQARAPAGPNPVYRVNIQCEAAEHVNINEVRLDGQALPLKSFLEKNVKSKNATYVRFRYIRNDLAKAIYNTNDFVSNWILTIMVMGISFLGIQVVRLEFTTYVVPNRFFRKILASAGNIKEERQRAFDQFATVWLKRDTLFQFLQLLGPALGFILTVSSLVEVLYPPRMGNDIEGFLAGIHIALISTFLGLAMRLVALEGARINDKLSDLFQLYFASIDVQPPVGAIVEPVSDASKPGSEVAQQPSGAVRTVPDLAQRLPATARAVAEPAVGELAQPESNTMQPVTELTQPVPPRTEAVPEAAKAMPGAPQPVHETSLTAAEAAQPVSKSGQQADEAREMPRTELPIESPDRPRGS
jgi:hypothetical protein